MSSNPILDTAFILASIQYTVIVVDINCPRSFRSGGSQCFMPEYLNVIQITCWQQQQGSQRHRR